MSCNCESLIKAIDAYIEKADDDLESALDDAGFIDAEDTVKEISSLEDKVAQALKDETKHVINSLKEASDEALDLEAYAREVWPDVKLTDDLSDKLRLVFMEEFTEFMPDLIGHYSMKIDPELTISAITQRTTSWIKNWSEELGDIMKLNSHNEIEKILETSLKEGQSVAECTQAILDSGIRDEYYKARRVATTEMLTAHSVAQQESFTQSPAVEEKMWRHTGSHKNEPRPNHVEMDGKRVPKDEPFVLEGADDVTYHPMYPRDASELPPGERINCHCIAQPVVSEEILGLPLEERQRLQQQAIDEDDGEWEKELDARNRAKASGESP